MLSDGPRCRWGGDGRRKKRRQGEGGGGDRRVAPPVVRPAPVEAMGDSVTVSGTDIGARGAAGWCRPADKRFISGPAPPYPALGRRRARCADLLSLRHQSPVDAKCRSVTKATINSQCCETVARERWRSARGQPCWQVSLLFIIQTRVPRIPLGKRLSRCLRLWLSVR